VREGKVVERDFHDYPILRMAAAPKVEVVLASSGDFFGGISETAIAVVAPAILNAVFAATGKRVRTLPITLDQLK